MGTPLKILILEDRADEALLLVHELRRSGYEPVWKRVETEPDYLGELVPDLDAILSDYSMPQFSAPRALELLQQSGFDIPFIIVTGTISEEVAVESIKQGAADYLLKDRLGRLGQAISRALGEKRVRQEKLLTEMALRQSEERYRMLVANIPDVTWTADAEGRSLFISPNAERILGCGGEELSRLGRNAWRNRIHPDDAERVAREYALLFSENKPFEVEYRVRRDDGGWIWIYDRAISTYEIDGTRYAYGICSDISERKRLEMQLQQAQRMESIGRLAGGVAHDFNNMLTVISGITDLMIMRLDESDPIRWQAEQIKKASERAAGMTRQLLAFSRQQVLQPRVLNLNSIVAETEKRLRRMVDEGRLEIRLSPDLGLVKADPGQLEQVIRNLVANARDAIAGSDGSITIETANVELIETRQSEQAHQPVIPKGRYVRLEVRDTGCGMDAATQARIFEPFFTTKEQGKGAGLGLATVYGIIKQSRGVIQVESEPGRGATFRIYLPQCEEEEEKERKDPSARGAAGRGGETILLVEDDEMVRSLTEQILRANGYHVLTAAEPDEAQRICREYEGVIHLLLTDTIMPQMKGPELAEKLQQLRPRMKVLFTSGFTDHEGIHRGASERNIAFLPKPFTSDALTGKVRETLDGST